MKKQSNLLESDLLSGLGEDGVVDWFGVSVDSAPTDTKETSTTETTASPRNVLAGKNSLPIIGEVFFYS